MDIAGQRRHVGNAAYMRFAVEDGLIQVGNTPALWDGVVEQCREFFGSLPGHIVAPGSKRHQLIVVGIKNHVAVHHAAEADGLDPFQDNAVLILNILLQVRKTGLNAGPHFPQRIGPDPVVQCVLPSVSARCDGGVIRADENRLDSGGSHFNPDDGLAVLNDCRDRRRVCVSHVFPSFRVNKSRKVTSLSSFSRDPFLCRTSSEMKSFPTSCIRAAMPTS